MAVRTAVNVVMAALIAMPVVGVGVAGSAPDETKARPDLSGRWALNRDLSENAQEKFDRMRAERSGMGGRGRGGMGGGMGRPGGGGGMGRGGGMGGGGEDMRAQMEEARKLALETREQFVVTQDEAKVTLTEHDGRVHTFYLDGRKVKAGNHEIQSKWRGNKLSVETKAGRVKVVDSYELAESGRQLIVNTTFAMRVSVKVRRVYDQVTDGLDAR